MPVTTRSQQIRLNVAEVVPSANLNKKRDSEKISLPNERTPYLENFVQKDVSAAKFDRYLENLIKKDVSEQWFCEYVNSCIKSIQAGNTMKGMKRLEIDAAKSPNEKLEREKEYRSIYFDQLRVMTELMYNVKEHLPGLLIGISTIGSYKMIRFAHIVYKKIQEMYHTVISNKFQPITSDEKNTVKSLFYTFQETEKVMVPIIEKNPLVKQHNIVANNANIKNSMCLRPLKQIAYYSNDDENENDELSVKDDDKNDADYSFEEDEDEDDYDLVPEDEEEDEDDYEDEEEDEEDYEDEDEEDYEDEEEDYEEPEYIVTPWGKYPKLSQATKCLNSTDGNKSDSDSDSDSD